jgi:hypothetical protein
MHALGQFAEARQRTSTGALFAFICILQTASAATFGTRVTIGGHVSDIALDERRQVLYIANFTADEIAVVSLRDNRQIDRIRVSPQPASLALSADGRYLVIAHHSTFPNQPPRYLGLTVRDLDANSTTQVDLTVAPLTIAFGIGPRALVVMRDGLWLFDPASRALDRVSMRAFDSGGLPVPFATFPPEIMRAASTVSGDGNVVWALLDAIAPPSSVIVKYDFRNNNARASEFAAVPAPALGPRVINTDAQGRLQWRRGH